MLQSNFTDFPILETERLVLRNIVDTDFEKIYELHSDAVVNAFVGRELSTTLEKSKAYILRMQKLVANNECLYWVIQFKENPELIGSVCCWNYDIENAIVEIGYEMLPQFQGKGIMSEALRAMMAFIFEVMEAEMITAFPKGLNVNSVAVLEKLGFKHEEHFYNNKHENVGELVSYTMRKPFDSVQGDSKV